MTGDEFKRIRKRYKETQLQFGNRLGWNGPDATVQRKVRAYESGERPISGMLEAFLKLLDRMPTAA